VILVAAVVVTLTVTPLQAVVATPHLQMVDGVLLTQASGNE